MIARGRRRPVFLLQGFLSILLATSTAAVAERKAPNLGLGYEYDLSGAREEFLLPDPLLDGSIVPDHPLYVRLRVPWSLLEPAAGTYDWSEADRIVAPYHEAHYVIILCLYGPNAAIDPSGGAPSAAHGEVLKAWLTFVRAAALHFKGRVDYYEVWDEPNRTADFSGGNVSEFAYLLKNTSVTIRSSDPGALIVQGGLAIGAQTAQADLAWQEALYQQGIATYVDVLPIHPAAGTSIAETVSRAYDRLLDSDPSAQLWVNRAVPYGDTDRDRAADLLRTFLVVQGEGASVVTFDLEADVEGRPEFPGVLLDIHKLFIPTYKRVPGGRLVIEPIEKGTAGPPGGVTVYRFFDAGSFQGLVGYEASAPPADRRARMILDTAAVQGVVVYDIIGGAAGPVRDVQPDFKSNTTRVPVSLYERPQVLQYSRVAIKGFEAEKEQVQVRETGLITAEEVIAGHQAFMADQDFRLRHYRADALLTYHGKVGGGDTIDVSIDNAFFWDRNTGAEWEQKALYYNGVLWKGKKIPELPIPQPEKVFTLPLDINLNKDYTYEYAGREKVGEFDCYVLDFKPIDRSKNLYQGRAWIETRTFAPVKTSTVQSRLSPPLISSDEKDYYRPMTGPDGTTYWLLARVEGQQILTVSGEDLVLLREIDFKDVVINDPDFDTARREAYRSDRPMLRDTDHGLRYLGRTDSGDRFVKEETAKSALVGLAGIYRQTGLDYPVLPLLGAFYFNYDVGGRKSQLTALLGGVVNLVSFTDPQFLGKRMDASAQVVTFAVNITDQLYVEGRKRPDSNVDTRSQYVTGALGWPLGNFMRVKLRYDLAYDNHSRDQDTRTFVVPSDTLTQSPGLEWEFNRSAWSLTASGQRSFRSRWKPWGDEGPATDPEILAQFPASPCDSPGSCLQDFDPELKTYDHYEFAVAKQIFLPLFQKLRFEATWQTGSRLDRFSEYQFRFFGNRVRGFSGSGVRYDRGGIARAQYSFNIANAVRFDASVDTAWVRDGLISDQMRRFTGFGISGNVMGPWDTILQFDVGVAVQSDFKDLRGDTEFQVTLLKYF
jgi:hypothetical protein